MLKTVNNQIPVANVVGLGTMATQNANAVAITGGTLNGVSAVNNFKGQVAASGGSTTTMFTLANTAANQTYLLF